MQQNNKSFRAIQFCDDFYPVIDGVVKVVDNCATHINKMDCVECEVVVPQYAKQPFDDSVFSYKVLRKPTNIIRFNKYPIPLPRAKKGLADEIIDFNADIYHVHSPFFMGDYALKLARKQNIPVVATFHSQFKQDFLQITHSKLITKMLLRRIIKFFNKCDEVWAPSQKSADTLKSYGFRKDVFVMENGTDFVVPDNLAELQEEARQAYGIDSNNKNLLYVGQLRFVKNLRLMLETLAELTQNDPSYHLYLVGEGSDEKELRSIANKLSLSQNVHFIEKIYDIKKLSALYSICDLFFFPSTYDTFSIVVREACIMKLPSLITRDSNVAEPFTDNVDCFWAEDTVTAMADRIRTIFADEQLRKAVGEQASTIPITFETMSKRTMERYKYILEHNKTRSSKAE